MSTEAVVELYFCVCVTSGYVFFKKCQKFIINKDEVQNIQKDESVVLLET
jgi:hypothetical protein